MDTTVQDIKAALDTGEDFVLLDCRNDNERSMCRIEPSLHIPMPQTPERIGELPADKPIVVYCHHGVRSRQVAGFLLEQGFADVRSMAGGIDAWSLHIDPGVPRYQ